MKKSILIVDDFTNTLFVTGFTLEMAGYAVLKASSGLEALKILKSDASVDLIISDYNMPNMNGIELISEIKKIANHRQTPIFILSTETNEKIKSSAYELGITGWIPKPFKSEKLIEYIKRAIGN